MVVDLDISLQLEMSYNESFFNISFYYFCMSYFNFYNLKLSLMKIG